VLREAGGAGTVHGPGGGAGEPDALVKVADGEQPGVAGELARRRLDDDRHAEKVQDLRPVGWYTHLFPARTNMARQRMRRIRREKIPQPAPGDAERLSC
jgi:hypothetical protein